MQKNKQIKALFFLGIFSVLLLHQVFPHLHHQHEERNVAIAHTEDHHHHHHDTSEKDDSSKNDFIDFFLGMHVHVFVTDEIPVIRNVINHRINDENIALELPLSKYFEVLKIYREIERPSIYNPPNNYFNHYFTNLDLRGPPVLG
tara:strand:- start:1659 stop:2093 length:435 start_codon:yes stop_codon:yes gene_type:complete